MRRPEDPVSPPDFKNNPAREDLAYEVELFLQRGGKIQQIPAGTSGDSTSGQPLSKMQAIEKLKQINRAQYRAHSEKKHDQLMREHRRKRRDNNQRRVDAERRKQQLAANRRIITDVFGMTPVDGE